MYNVDVFTSACNKSLKISCELQRYHQADILLRIEEQIEVVFWIYKTQAQPILLYVLFVLWKSLVRIIYTKHSVIFQELIFICISDLAQRGAFYTLPRGLESKHLLEEKIT